MRDFHWNEDFERARQFLIDIWNAGPLYRNWIPSGLENRKFGPGGNEYLNEEDEYVKLWEDSESNIVAITIVNPSGECWINIHPEHLDAEEELVFWIEDYRRGSKKDLFEEVPIQFVVQDDDEQRQNLLKKLGYDRTEVEGVDQVYDMSHEPPDYQLPEGYSVRHVAVNGEWEKYRAVQKAVFTHIKDMSQKILYIYSTASFYVPELDIVAVDPDGNFAAFCTGRIDPVSKIAELEPVGTHPDHRKKGLGKAVILECIKRLKEYEPPAIVILGAAATDGANRLYESVGFMNKGLRYYWTKRV